MLPSTTQIVKTARDAVGLPQAIRNLDEALRNYLRPYEVPMKRKAGPGKTARWLKKILRPPAPQMNDRNMNTTKGKSKSH